jgi:hypothetical protein
MAKSFIVIRDRYSTKFLNDCTKSGRDSGGAVRTDLCDFGVVTFYYTQQKGCINFEKTLTRKFVVSTMSASELRVNRANVFLK